MAKTKPSKFLATQLTPADFDRLQRLVKKGNRLKIDFDLAQANFAKERQDLFDEFEQAYQLGRGDTVNPDTGEIKRGSQAPSETAVKSP